MAPDQITVLRQSNVKFTLKDATHNATNVTLFGQLKFDAAGVYSVEVLVDDVMKLRYPLMLTVVKQPAQDTAPSDPESDS